MRAVPLLFLALLAPTLALAQDLSGRYELRGLEGFRPVHVQLDVRPAGAGSWEVERVLTRAGQRTTYRGEGWQEGSRLRVRFDLRPGASGALRGGVARRAWGDYRIHGGVVAGTFRDQRTSRELGRRRGAPPRRPSAALPALPRPPAQLIGRLEVEGRRLLDPFGREVVLRGVNAGSKRAPFLPAHGDADVAALARATGANLVRLFVAWRAIEPAPGRYDAAYLDAVLACVRRFRAAGLYVLVDMHQDVWGGPVMPHGAPEWATLAAHHEPLSLPAGASWQLRYADRRVYRSFEALWSNQPVPATGRGLADHFAGAWAALAERLRGEDGVVGYDLLNEPFVGRELLGGLAAALARSAPTLLGSGVRAGWRRLIGGGRYQDLFLEDLLLRVREADRYERLLSALRRVNGRFERRLSAFYERVGRAIRRADPGRPLFVEPMALVGVGVPSEMPRPGLEGLVYAPHLYDAFVDSGLPYDGDPSRVAATLRAHQRSAWRLGAPLVIGEWGHLSPRAGDPARFSRDVGRLLDGALAGAAYWEHVPGREADPLFLTTARPYPRRVVGRLRAWSFAEASGELELELAAEPSPAAPTVIALPRHRYPSGVAVTLQGPRAAYEHQPAEGRLLVWTQERGALRIRVRPAP